MLRVQDAVLHRARHRGHFQLALDEFRQERGRRERGSPSVLDVAVLIVGQVRAEDLGDAAQIDQKPLISGRVVTMLVSPGKAK